MLRFGCCEWLVSDLLRHEGLGGCSVAQRNIDVYEIGKKYDYGSFTVEPVRLTHDVPNCGYKLNFGSKKAIYITDTAHVRGIEAKNYDLYLVEANYTDEDLKERIRKKEAEGLYAYERNVAGRHLSKKQCNDFIYANMGPNSRYIYLHEHIERE